MGSFPLSLADTILLLRFQRVCPGRNRSKRKYDENTIYEPREIQGLYITKFHIKRKVLGENESEAESGVDSPPGDAAKGGPVPQGGVSHPGSVSVIFFLRSFPY